MTRRVTALALAIGLVAAHDALAQGQGRGRGAPAGPPPTARASAPKDFTGYWVSIVTEHWHLRMLVPPKGDYSMLPLNPERRGRLPTRGTSPRRRQSQTSAGLMVHRR